MTKFFSKKYRRDQALFKEWDKLGDAAFKYISREEAKAYQTKLQGQIVWPFIDQKAYEQDRKLFNPVFDPHPFCIVYCKVEADVAIALDMAERYPVPFAVRSSGHSTAGFSAGLGVLIDVSELDAVTIDNAAQIATVATACPFSALDSALTQAGLHVPGGECPDVCIAGFMQGGGYGFTSVTYGMNCDNVIDMRVMLADGTIVVASATENSDLYWAMRGSAGGNFGVLLTVRLQLRPMGDAFGWALIWPLKTDTDIQNATGALSLLQSKYMLGNLPKELNIQVSLAYQPDTSGGKPVPSPMDPYLMVRGLYVGTQADGEAAIASLAALPGAITQWTAMDTFSNLNVNLLNKPYSLPCLDESLGMPYEDKASRYVSRVVTDDEWKKLLQFFVTSPNEQSYFYMEFYGGAINAFPAYPAEGSNAFVHRDSSFNAVLDVFWYNGPTKDADKAKSEKFLQDWIDLMAPMWNQEIYQNYPQVNQPDYGNAYWADAQSALYAVKQKYDPKHRFQYSQGVAKPMIDTPLPQWLQTALAQPIVPGV